MKREEVDRALLSPMLKQYMDIKDQYDDSILLFRLGDFYEMFFEDAILISHDLELTLTSKSAGLGDRIPMCGIPSVSLNLYLKKLIDCGHKVAVCEQVEDPKNTKGIVKREVTEVVSRGTIINSEALDEDDNNYIGSILYEDSFYYITYADITTGDIYTFKTSCKDSDLIKTLINIDIKELVLIPSFDKNISDILKNQYKVIVSYNEDFNHDNKTITKYITDNSSVKSISLLINYLSIKQKRNLSHLKTVIIKNFDEVLQMDVNTVRNLELIKNQKLGSKSFSLLWLLDKTKTVLGSRYLKKLILNPLINKEEINKRYDLIEILNDEFILREELKELLYQIYDLERLIGRVSFDSANAKDLIQLKESIRVLPDIKNILTKLNFREEFNTLTDLFKLLDESIYENPPFSIKEGYIIKDGYNKDLDYLRNIRSGNKDFILNLENEEKMRTNIKTLKVGFNKVFGYYIEVSKGQTHLIKEEYGYERKQTLADKERYITPLLKEKENLILSAEEKIINLEYELFIEIRNKVKAYISEIQEVSSLIAYVDVLQSFSTVSEQNSYVRPIISDERIINIKDSKHPVIEAVIKDKFISNDIYMDEDNDIILITGPNMAGKSTYMRQLAIMVIMTQIGCFVPAKYAMLPIFDKIFTRIGASDDIVSGDSTFMVEMLEANNALINATDNSLILFDELGRGTATYDGVSLAEAILEHLHENTRAKTIFSTHYHELTKLDQSLPRLKNMHVSAKLDNDRLIFLRKVLDGAIDKSYGINVAELASMPNSLIKRAKFILDNYESQVINKKDEKVILKPIEEIKEESKIIEKLKSIDAYNLTPRDAINIIFELMELIKVTNNN